MAISVSSEQFATSCENASTYPQNLSQCHGFEYKLKAYNDRLSLEKEKLFHDNKHAIFMWDLVDGAKAFSLSSEIESATRLKEHLNKNLLDPLCRFVFLKTLNSRERMCCTFEQLTYLLSYHQVMPLFLDFCFELRSRIEPISTTLFRQKDYIGKHYIEQGLDHLGRSGSRLQHAFNILGFDEEKSIGGSEYSWPLRHITVYHSFDVKLGRSFWIIIKGNDIMRKRITSSTGNQKANPSEINTPTGAFVASLRIHLLILEWCTNHWNDYIDSLYSKAREFSATVTHYPVTELARDIPTSLAHSSSEITRHSRRATDISQGTGHASSTMTGIFARLSSGLLRMTSGFSAHARSTTQQPLTGANFTQRPAHPEKKMRDVKLEDIFTFTKLQRLHKLSSTVKKASMNIEQNKRILALIRGKYKALVESSSFKSLFNVKSCEAELMDFLDQIRNLEGDLQNFETRLRTLLWKLEKDEGLFTGVLQYQSMQTGEFFSKSADNSAAKMKELTIKMHDIAARTEQETVAMGVITFFTLVFLPGTFVATFFSSNILKFDNSTDGEMGSWVLQIPALKLFLTMSLPLMFITLTAWWVLRRSAGRKYRTRAALEELPFVEKAEGTGGVTI
ncbi:hypothetical protein QQS21_005795 [Conoideocrella luteorostrata]|uniref:CorA-like transporter domain-containing protein n=1 Tax=Conoideocrella luteorostrata TaxID=1105319 RepID=A0AAJ0CP38_9HYPO|nr:hypothetical protein QQS21_005795 [Conoideocrella luteorostrata]